MDRLKNNCRRGSSIYGILTYCVSAMAMPEPCVPPMPETMVSNHISTPCTESHETIHDTRCTILGYTKCGITHSQSYRGETWSKREDSPSIDDARGVGKLARLSKPVNQG